jgi:hypothetical protein
MSSKHTLQRNEQIDLSNGTEAKFDYLAYAIWQREVLTPRGAAYQNQLTYWKGELDGARALSFPNDPTAIKGGSSGGMVTRCISSPTLQQSGSKVSVLTVAHLSWEV